jgi:4a-hydroxytetrahydrobiopterin dehydratase
MHALSVAFHHSRVMKPNVCRHSPNWNLADDAHRIERTFRFRNFQDSFAFVQKVGELAEPEGHHPDISFGWGYATVSLSTKKIKGLHENDFIMATKIDRVLDRQQ